MGSTNGGGGISLIFDFSFV